MPSAYYELWRRTSTADHVGQWRRDGVEGGYHRVFAQAEIGALAYPEREYLVLPGGETPTVGGRAKRRRK